MTSQLIPVVCLLSGLMTTIVEASVSMETLTTYDKLYDLGMDAYRKENWVKCIDFWKRAIEDFRLYRDGVIDCRLKCGLASDIKLSSTLVFQTVLEKSNCLRKCKKGKFGARQEDEMASSYDKKFEDRQPYNYLQFCQYQNGDLKAAAAAMFTYYLTHQDDTRVSDTLQFYRRLPSLTDADFIDLERRPYQKAYVAGLVAYNAADWIVTAEKFESALTLYFKEEERCRARCEHGFTHTGYPDILNAVADHYVMVIVCQQKCLTTLSIFGMEELENFVSEHYNYLQYSYYHMGNHKKACEAIASFLLFQPDDQSMLQNQQYHTDSGMCASTDFTPTQAAMDYKELWDGIEYSLSYVRDQYVLPRDELPQDDDDEQTDETSDIEPEEVEKSSDDSKPKDSAGEFRAQRLAKFEEFGIHPYTAFDLGQTRAAADDIIRSDQCLALEDLVKMKKRDKTGMRQADLKEMIQIVKDDETLEISLRLLLKVGDVVTLYSSVYFNQSSLDIQDVSVVCRSAGSEWEGKVDKECVQQEDGSCLGTVDHESDYTVVSYLSTIQDGTGQLFFMDTDNNVQSSISPRCGRFVTFSPGDKHGVNLSWKQDRCAIVYQLTKNSRRRSKDIPTALNMLFRMDDDRVAAMEPVDNTELLEQFYGQGIKISETATELLGKERFVADGLSTINECQDLIQVAKSKGVVGDGYRGKVSPHTDRELFTGVEANRFRKKSVIRGDGYGKDWSDGSHSKFISPYSKSEHFEGLNITRTLKLVESDQLPARALQLYLDLSEHSRLLVERYLNLTKPLHFDFTHLVCRTAVKDYDGNEEETLSHPVHSDNCMIQPDGSCIVDSLAFQQRHYSAVLYLNEDFEGGEFFFAFNNKSEQVSVKPKCGRLVAFNAGDYHGVKAVRKGCRCAIAMWYTHDPNFVEVSRIHAQRRLDEMGEDESQSEVNKADVDEDFKDFEISEDLEDTEHDEL